ncbi:hypothetical protein GCM10027280_60490 [Micromonospora polyrhachis]
MVQVPVVVVKQGGAASGALCGGGDREQGEVVVRFGRAMPVEKRIEVAKAVDMAAARLVEPLVVVVWWWYGAEVVEPDRGGGPVIQHIDVTVEGGVFDQNLELVTKRAGALLGIGDQPRGGRQGRDRLSDEARDGVEIVPAWRYDWRRIFDDSTVII